MNKIKSIIGMVVVLLCIQVPNSLQAQNGFSITSGIGGYELASIGTQWNYSKTSSVEFSIGSNFGLNEETLWSTGLTFNQVFQKPQNWKIKPGYSLGLLYWTQDDDLYLFKTVSLPVMLLAAYRISENLQVRLEGGMLFSTVVSSERKQNVQSGFPDRMNGNFAVKFIYKIKRNEK